MKYYFWVFFLFSYLVKAQFFAPAYPNSISKNNLIVNYDFANPTSYAGAGTSVASTNGINLPATLSNSPVFYKDPGYLKFNAANAHYMMMGDLKNYYPPVSSSSRSGVFTISLWFNPTAANGVVLSDLNSTTISGGYHTSDIEMVGGYLKFSVWPKNVIITSASTVSLNTWHHVVLTYTGNSIVAYLDGALINSATYTRDGPAMASLTSSQYFALAATESTHMGSGAYGSFLLADVKWYATSLSAAEVNQLYLDEAPEYDLVLMLDASKNYLSYPGSGTTWNDISGNAKTATNAAGVSYSTSGNGIMYYNGTSTGYTDFNFNLGSATTLSFEMWVYPTTLTNSMFFGFNLYDVYANSGSLGFNSSMGDNYGITAAQVSSLGLLNNWNHYVFVMNSGSYLQNKIYINGVKQTLTQIQGSQNTSTVNFNGGVGRIACWIFNNNFMQNMYLSKFKVYRRELTQNEITSKFNNSTLTFIPDGLTPATASTSAYQIKQDYPSSTDGFYWIKNANINGGAPFKIYADMTTDGGGWTLILKNSSNSVWSYANTIAYNTSNPFSTAAEITSTSSSSYSIIGWADYIKKSSSGFQYMIEAGTRGNYGGIWTANAAYSFVSSSNANSNITLNTKFGTWNYVASNNGMAPRMPWYGYVGSNTGFITLSDGTGNWWGTMVSNNSYYSPSPWISDAGGGAANANPVIIWYWVR
jgi:hypothetical protein